MLMLTALAGALASDTAAPPEPAAPRDPAFECFHVNHAWGFALAGSVLDRDGAIYRYRTRGVDRSPAAEKSGGATYFAGPALRAKFAEAARGGAVDAALVAEKLALAEKAATGAVTRADTGTRDAGVSTCHAYLRDAASDRYRDVELGSDNGAGDVRLRNDAPEAQALLEWLSSIGAAQ